MNYISLIVSTLWVIAALAMIFVAGWQWRDGHRWVSAFCLLASVVSLIGQTTNFLVWLGPHIK
jgi:hypothetical protein